MASLLYATIRLIIECFLTKLWHNWSDSSSLGSLSAFFLPMIVMVNSYVLTVRLLRRKAKFYQDSSHNYSTSSGKESSDFNSSKKNASSSGI